MRTLLALLTLAAVPVSAHATACPVQREARAFLNDAEAALDNGDFKLAATRYEDLLAKAPGDPQATFGAVFTFILENDLSSARHAVTTALAAHPQDASVLTAQGLLEYREGRLPEADKDFDSALHANPCFAPAYVGRARIAGLRGMRATRLKLLDTAHRLDGADPIVQRAWATTLTVGDRIANTRRELEQPGITPERKQSAEAFIERADAFQQHPCKLIGNVESATVPLVRLQDGPNRTMGWALNTGIGDKSAHLMLDSGSSGLYISRSFAAAAGLKPVGKSQDAGIGDHGPQSGFYAFAEKIHIGALEFQNCVVRVSDHRDVIGTDGLLGTDVFAKFLITIDYPAQAMRLAPLPGAATEVASLGTSDLPQEHENTPLDAYSGPELKGFFPVYCSGSKLLVPAHIDKKGPFLLLLDTGAGVLSITAATAEAIGAKPHPDPTAHVEGVSGRVEKLKYISHANLQFGNGSAEVEQMLVFDEPGMERSTGVGFAGFLGGPILQRTAVTLDYRDAMIKLDYNAAHDRQAGHQLDPLDKACVVLGQCEHR